MIARDEDTEIIYTFLFLLASEPTNAMAEVALLRSQGVKRKPTTQNVSLEEHLRRFRETTASLPSMSGWKHQKTGPSSEKIVGTSTQLEKAYKRTSFVVEPQNVRSRPTCEKAFEYLKLRWASSQEHSDYKYVGEQFKSLRQDIRVQSIQDHLAVSIYEANARICLEVGDFSEFNQCQSRLMELYIINPSSPNRAEFWSYRILYAVAIDDVSSVLAEQAAAKEAKMNHEMVRSALSMALAARSGNYFRFFSLLKKVPRYSKVIVEKLKWSLRFEALQSMIKAYTPGKYPLSQLVRVLGFSSKVSALRWIQRCGVEVRDDAIICSHDLELRRPRVRSQSDTDKGVTHGALV